MAAVCISSPRLPGTFQKARAFLATTPWPVISIIQKRPNKSSGLMRSTPVFKRFYMVLYVFFFIIQQTYWYISRKIGCSSFTDAGIRLLIEVYGLKLPHYDQWLWDVRISQHHLLLGGAVAVGVFRCTTMVVHNPQKLACTLNSYGRLFACFLSELHLHRAGVYPTCLS